MLTLLVVMLIMIKLVYRIEHALNKKSLEKYEQLKTILPEENSKEGAADDAQGELKKLQYKTANRGCTIFIVGFLLSWFAGYLVAKSMNRFFPAELVQIGNARLVPFGDAGAKDKPYFLGVGSLATTKFYFYIPKTSQSDIYKPTVALFGKCVTIYEEARKGGRVLIYAKRPPSEAFLFSIPEPIEPEEEKQYEFQIPKGSKNELFKIE